MPKSLSEFAKATPGRGSCALCHHLLTPDMVKELNQGQDSGVGGDVIIKWLKAEHDIDIASVQLSNHKRGREAHPERHSG